MTSTRLSRRSFVAAFLASPLLGACGRAASQDSGDSSWPGPSTPRSYRANPPPAIGERLVLSEDEWRRRLTREQFEILREQRTEPSFSCELWQEHRRGAFYCGGCGAPLFSSAHKFDSGTGWASFYQPVERGRVTEHSDRSFGMVRTEVRCARCDGHLGHVFDDGPPPTGRRYCINGSILEFVPS